MKPPRPAARKRFVSKTRHNFVISARRPDGGVQCKKKRIMCRETRRAEGAFSPRRKCLVASSGGLTPSGSAEMHSIQSAWHWLSASFSSGPRLSIWRNGFCRASGPRRSPLISLLERLLGSSSFQAEAHPAGRPRLTLSIFFRQFQDSVGCRSVGLDHLGGLSGSRVLGFGRPSHLRLRRTSRFHRPGRSAARVVGRRDGPS